MVEPRPGTIGAKVKEDEGEVAVAATAEVVAAATVKDEDGTTIDPTDSRIGVGMSGLLAKSWIKMPSVGAPATPPSALVVKAIRPTVAFPEPRARQGIRVAVVVVSCKTFG